MTAILPMVHQIHDLVEAKPSLAPELADSKRRERRNRAHRRRQRRSSCSSGPIAFGLPG